MTGNRERGRASLTAGHGPEAAAEFQTILDHPGLVYGDPLVVVAHRGLARTYALQGQTNRAKIAYEDFLALWKDVGPDIPILRHAKAEYATLQKNQG